MSKPQEYNSTVAIAAVSVHRFCVRRYKAKVVTRY